MKPTQEQLEKFNRHHLPNRIESKWIGNMSKDELIKAEQDYQKLVELDEKEKDNE